MCVPSRVLLCTVLVLFVGVATQQTTADTQTCRLSSALLLDPPFTQRKVKPGVAPTTDARLGANNPFAGWCPDTAKSDGDW